MAHRAMSPLADRIAAAVRRRREDIVSLASDLIRIPSENPPGRHYRACVTLLADRIRAIGLQPELIEIPGVGDGEARTAVIATYGRGTRTMYFHGHYDVVPASTDGQFEPRLEGGTLFGRGSADMKSGLAAMLYAVAALDESGISLDGRIGLTFVPDEETGGALGSRYLADAGLLGRDGVGMLTAEPTGGVVWNANRGAISLLVTVKGRPAHVGLQHQGVNAFERMMTVAGMLAGLKTDVESRRTSFVLHPDAARTSILLIGGRSEGGSNFNVVPGECRFTVDRRLNPEEDYDTEKRRLLDVFDSARARGIDLEVEIFQEGRPSGTADHHEVARALAASVEEVIGSAPVFEMCPGLLETRFYAERGVPAFAYGPGLLAVSHGPKEFVKIDAVLDCATVYALTAARLLGR